MDALVPRIHSSFPDPEDTSPSETAMSRMRSVARSRDFTRYPWFDLRLAAGIPGFLVSRVADCLDKRDALDAA